MQNKNDNVIRDNDTPSSSDIEFVKPSVDYIDLTSEPEGEAIIIVWRLLTSKYDCKLSFIEIRLIKKNLFVFFMCTLEFPSRE